MWIRLSLVGLLLGLASLAPFYHSIWTVTVSCLFVLLVVGGWGVSFGRLYVLQICLLPLVGASFSPSMLILYSGLFAALLGHAIFRFLLHRYSVVFYIVCVISLICSMFFTVLIIIIARHSHALKSEFADSYLVTLPFLGAAALVIDSIRLEEGVYLLSVPLLRRTRFILLGLAIAFIGVPNIIENVSGLRRISGITYWHRTPLTVRIASFLTLIFYLIGEMYEAVDLPSETVYTKEIHNDSLASL